MIVLDAYGLVALLADEPAAEEAGRLIAGNATAVTAPNLAEAADRLGRVKGIAVQRTRSLVESLEQSTALHIRDTRREDAWWAAEIRVAGYHRTRCPLSLGDCLLLAMTGPGERLATSDLHVLATAQARGIGWIALPDSSGQRHDPV